MRRVFQIVLPLVILAITAFVVNNILSNPNKPKTKKVERPPVFVETISAKKENFSVLIETQGEVKARIYSKIIPEVSGRITSISDNFFNGKFFKKDEILVQIDPRDYEIALSKAKADLIKAETEFEQEKIRTQNFKTAIINGQNVLQNNILIFKEEEARGQQALTDWKKLGRKGEPSELVLRKPQLKAALAAVESAKADIEKAERDLGLVDALLKNSQAAIDSAKAEVRQKEINLERCTIKAPFNGRILSKSVNVGQYISPGNTIAEIYGIDVSEVRLPVSTKDLQYMNLPEDSPNADSHKAEVLFSLQNGEEKNEWKGFLDRTESAMDSKSRQHYVIGQVQNPYDGKRSLKPGVFVKAQISGKTLPDIYVIPISALRESSYLWIVNEKSELQKKPVSIVWRNFKIAAIRGLEPGDKICITSLTFARNGLIVTEEGKEEKK
ncbi:MAG: efflux RND transporter periplasmic adaptor subunit [Lentisphaeraceae bacterium]|nr:efflux RND transporter periplasmic adaptor subunit [Lentisphaeraceae bacterium]